MNYKKICTILAIIIIACVALVGVLNIKSEYEHTQRIENILDFSDQEKSSINYQNLIRDIKLIENGKKIKYAKNTSGVDSSNKDGNVKVVVESKEYQGDGYTIDTYKTSGTPIYNIYVGDECVYSVSENMLKEQKRNKKIELMATIMYVIISICIVLELIFLFKWAKRRFSCPEKRFL